MAEILSLLQDAAQVARRCPNPTLSRAYLRAAQKFCTESRWLRRTVEVDTEGGLSLYTLDLPSADQVLEIIGTRLIRVTSSTAPLNTWTIRPSDPTTWCVNQARGKPRTYGYQPESQVELLPTPDDVYQLAVIAQCTPVRDAIELPDDLLTKWDRALTDGALAYLLNLPDQPWSNPNLARNYAVAFQAAINNAKADEQRAYNTGTVMARIRRLF